MAAKEWLDFAMYTVESRAIPNMIDGMKPVQRFYLYSSIMNSPKEFRKVSGVAGVLSDYGYHHGEVSGASAGQLMAATWNNNVCLIEGSGSFGTRQVPVPAASRYTFTRVHANFGKYIKDIDLAPEHPDPEHIPPRYYIPTIPLVLANGVKGIATGFATTILPRSAKDLVIACAEYLKTGGIEKRVPVTFPEFKGTVTYVNEENRFYCEGVFEKRGKTVLVISEIPYGISREEYVVILDKLEETGDIVSYEDQCDKSGFKFEVKLKQNTSANWDDDKIKKAFKLVKTFTENLTVIDQNGKLKEYADERELIKDFVDFKNGILQQRIEKRIVEHDEILRWNKVKIKFINAVIDDLIVFKGKKRDQIVADIKAIDDQLSDEDADRLLKMQIMSLTSDMIEKLQNEIVEAEKMLEYWKQTTPKKQFIIDLKELV